MKRILVTGGAGYIGSHTVVELVNAGYTPIIIDNFSNSHADVINHLQSITGTTITHYDHDYSDPKILEHIFTTEHISGVIHFAAHKIVGASITQPLDYYHNNVGGLVSLLQAMVTYKVPHIVFSSSANVYGEADTLPVTEEAPIKPATSPYGTTKQMGETIIRDSAQAYPHLRAIALRYFNPVGAHPSGRIGELPLEAPTNLIPLVTQAAAGLRPELVVYGNDYDTPDGSCIRDFIHVVDLAKAHIKALEYLRNAKAPFDVCNVGTGKGSSILETLTLFEQVTGQKVPHRIGSRRDGDIIVSYASVDKAKQLLNWQAERDLGQALVDAWRWQKTLDQPTP